jgi:hypothetical protein
MSGDGEAIGAPSTAWFQGPEAVDGHAISAAFRGVSHAAALAPPPTVAATALTVVVALLAVQVRRVTAAGARRGRGRGRSSDAIV